MNHEMSRDYLMRAEMNEGQAEALSRIFEEMATKSDLDNLEERIRAELATVRTELATMCAELTWKIIAIVGFFATVTTLLNLFAG